MIWKLCEIQPYLSDIQSLFEKTKGHKHEDNYIKWPLFEYTKFARMCWNPHLIYYSAGIERPEYAGGIRIMSRHTRDRSYPLGNRKENLNRGLQTLDALTDAALDLGYKNIFMSREENSHTLKYLKDHSKHKWNLTYEKFHYGGYQYVIRIL